MFGCCLDPDQNIKFFKSKQTPPFNVNLSIKENHLVFTFSGTSAEVYKHFRQCLQTVKLNHYQVDENLNSNRNQEKKSCYHLAIKLTNSAAIIDMFWYLKKVNIDTYKAIQLLPGSEKESIEKWYKTTQQVADPLTYSLEIIRPTPGR